MLGLSAVHSKFSVVLLNKEINNNNFEKPEENPAILVNKIIFGRLQEILNLQREKLGRAVQLGRRAGSDSIDRLPILLYYTININSVADGITFAVKF